MVLLVLDGWGIAPPSAGNALEHAHTPVIDRLMSVYPHTHLIASGESVGLPANEVGNTEVGHLNLGAGRLIYQDLKRISIAIENGSFFENKAFIDAAEHVQQHDSRLHVMGLVGRGNVHSSLDHLYAILKFARTRGVKEVLVHAFTDGRDTPPQEGAEVIEELETYMRETHSGRIATVSGRYFAMDRDMRWERTEKAYNAIVAAQGPKALSAVSLMRDSYSRGLTDEFIEPTIITGEEEIDTRVRDNDAVIFFNFRIDRPRQLTMAFLLPEFEHLKSFEWGYVSDRTALKGTVSFEKTFIRAAVPRNLFFVTMTEYQKNLPASAVAFGKIVVEDSLAEVIAKQKLTQLHLAESEKERFVTYYFRGMREQAFDNEDVIIIPSPKVATYDKKPEMSLPTLATTFIDRVSRKSHDFYIMNIANPDMVGHTGNLAASIKACEIVDTWVGKIVDAVLSVDGTVVITADHGNVEELITYPTGTFFYTSDVGDVNTDHSNNPVPLIIVRKDLMGKSLELPPGDLTDVAPTILTMMKLPIPEAMKGKNLLTL